MRSKGLAAAATTAVVVLASAGSAFAAGTSPTAPPSTPPSAPATAKPACDTDTHWPAYVQGHTDAFDAHDDGVYLWHNPEGGWGLRVSHPVLPGGANRVVFSGTITSKGTIGTLKRVKDEKDDKIKVGHHGHTLAFRFVNYGGVDGLDFTTTCTPGLRAALRADSQPMQTRFIHLGDHKVNPGSNPFVVHRRDADTTTSAH